MEIFVRMKGGLGNQLFQLAAAKRIRINSKHTPILDVSSLTQLGRIWTLVNGFQPRSLELPKGLMNQFGISRSLLMQLNRKLRKEASNSKYVFVDDSNFATVTFTQSSNYLVEGYFQRQEYAQLVRAELIELIETAPSTSTYLDSDSLAIQMRLGDFIRSSGQVELNTANWLVEATQAVLDGDKFRRIVLFSDRPKEALRIMNTKFKSTSVEIAEPSGSPFEVLSRLSRFRKRILSASSFGWWASFLASQNSEDVFPPSYRKNPLLFSS